METSVEPFFKLPKRSTPVWETVETVSATTRDIIIKVATGKLPIGKLPWEIITEAERQAIVAGLANLTIRQYHNTDDTEKVMVLGNPFVDSSTVQGYLSAKPNRAFEDLTNPLLYRVINAFTAYGFDVNPLIDPVTQLAYPAKVVRQIQLPAGCYKEDGNICSVLHCDDILRDGSKKPDFVIPAVLENTDYSQFSVCLQLEDGGYPPDNLYVFEKKYSAEMERDFYGAGLWRYPAAKLNNCRSHFYRPELRQVYFFSTQNFHDVRGGHPLAKRVNLSVFFIYIPGTNSLYYYN